MKKEVIIINTELAHFTFDDESEKDMTKIEYATKVMSDTEERVGLSVLSTYVDESAFDVVKSYIGKTIDATFIETPTKNGVKYKMTSIDGIEF